MYQVTTINASPETSVDKMDYIILKSWNKIQDENRSSKPLMACTPEMVDSVNAPILVDKRVTIEDISEQLGISVDTEHKFVHDNRDLSKITCRWVSPKQYKASYCSKNSGNHVSLVEYSWHILVKV